MMIHVGAVFVAVLLQGFFITGSNALGGVLMRGTRSSCFVNVQKNCNEDFTDVYKNVSKSVSGEKANSFFLLYTRRNKKNPEKLHKCAGRLPPNSKFDKSKRVIVLIPGFLNEWCSQRDFRDWKDEILKKEDANVIGIDYSWQGEVYNEDVENIKIAAKQVVILLKNIQAQTGVENLNVYLVGFSLGSQMSGFIGQDFPIKRITGLDPAGPSFEKDRPANERLDPSDAELVDVVHCNARMNGIPYDAGHINFWMNGGSVQDVCDIVSVTAPAMLDGAATSAGNDGCYHISCPWYFNASINDCNFMGIKCPSYDDLKSGKCMGCGRNNNKCAVAGFDLDKSLKKIPQEPQKYYVKTTNEHPYCDNSYTKKK